MITTGHDDSAEIDVSKMLIAKLSNESCLIRTQDIIFRVDFQINDASNHTHRTADQVLRDHHISRCIRIFFIQRKSRKMECL